ncbi:MAG: PTS sugar transporter subunit IIA [Pseudomonadota bacterium]|nr:PTS sugar transporter subunit IIA [Pseudomonadota bacterium]
MIGILLVTHGQIGQAYIETLELISGKQDHLAALAVGPDDDMEECRTAIIDKVRDLDAGSGVIVLTDMFGGTPSNLAISVMDACPVEVLAGVNLPMLIKLTEIRSDTILAEAAEAAAAAGRKYINVASAFLEASGQ